MGSEKDPSLVGLAACSSEGEDQRENFPKKIERYSKAKSRALEISDYISTRSDAPDDLASQVRRCGSYLVFRDYYTVNQIKLIGADFCRRHLLCPLCAIRRGVKTLSRYLDRYHDIIEDHPDLRPWMVTLTVKDGVDLRERFGHLHKSLALYHKRRHRQNTRCEAKKALGAVWSYEVKRGQGSGLWHPHVHSVWLCKSPPDASQLSVEWKQITGDSYIVDVRPISQADPVDGFLEVFKYAVKFNDQEPEDIWTAYKTLSGRRLIGSFGLFYGIPEPDDLHDDPLEGLPYIERFMQFIEGSYRQTNAQHVSAACDALK